MPEALSPITTQFHDFDATVTEPLLDVPDMEVPPRRLGLNLFWRTFFLLTALLLGSLFAWLQTLHLLEFEAHAIDTAQELASQINLSRAVLLNSDAIARVALLKIMSEEEGLRILPREPSDTYVALGVDTIGRKMTQELSRHLGPGTVVASSVNARPGLWVGFLMGGDPFWLLTDHENFNPVRSTTWLIWLSVAVALSLCGAALIARRINRPLKELSIAAGRVREGRFEASRLDETVTTAEIRDVNVGFNRMAQKLAKIEQDRAVMLAGISHDLRTPLARLRLETELSVRDPEARAHMAADIEQLDAIVDKFLDYAKPDKGELDSVVLGDVVDACVYAFAERKDAVITTRLEPELRAKADAVELGRVFSNLLENACRYGKSPESGRAHIVIAAKGSGDSIHIKIRDRGVGVPQEQLTSLTQPFYRGEAARTAANGAGLGLAIVDKAVRRMGGDFAITNATSGGLSANIRLQRAMYF